MLTYNTKTGRPMLSLPAPSRGKYKSRKVWYNGAQYHSVREAQYAHSLDLRVRAKEITSWKRQVKIPLKVGDVLITNYIIDFVVTYNSGRKEYLEVKGFETDVWKIKWKLFKVLYGSEFKKKGWVMTVGK